MIKKKQIEFISKVSLMVVGHHKQVHSPKFGYPFPLTMTFLSRLHGKKQEDIHTCLRMDTQGTLEEMVDPLGYIDVQPGV